MPKFRKCKVCGEKKPIDAFGNMTKGVDGKKSHCKECENQKRKERRAAGKAPAAEKRSVKKSDPSKPNIGDSWWNEFLTDLGTHGIVTRAAEKANINHATVYKTAKENPKFNKIFEEVRNVGLRRCVDEAIRRGADGWEEPIFHQGEICGYKRRFSDKLLEFIIRGNFEQYRNLGETNVNVNNNLSTTDMINNFMKSKSISDNEEDS
jgi:hypothetical protein